MKPQLHIFFLIKKLLLTAIFLFAFSSAAVAQNLLPAAQDKIADLVEMEQQLSKTGEVRIIIEFNTRYAKAADLSDVEAQQFRSEVSTMQQQALDQLDEIQAQSVRRYRSIPAMAMKTDQDGINKLLTDDNIKAIHFDKIEDAHLGNSIGIVGADSVWDLGFTGSSQAIVILDTGVDSDHDFLGGRVVAEACFSTDDPSNDTYTLCPDGTEEQIGTGAGADCDGASGCGHGTHVAGIAAGSGVDRDGVAKGADIISIQVFSEFTDPDDCGSNPAPCVRTYTSDLISAMEHVNDVLTNDHDIASVNMSLGGGEYTSTCDDDIRKPIIDQLKTNNIVTVSSSGNDGYDDAIGAPACISSVIAVGNTDKSDNVVSGSNSNSLVDILAPGTSINSSLNGGGFGTKSGTSMSAPHVAGAYALLREANPNDSIDELTDRLVRTGTAVTDSKNSLTKPRMNVDQASAIKHITSNITENTTWGDDATTTYIIENSVSITTGAELTILDGIDVLFNEGERLTVQGTLDADGVLFSANDDSPTPEFWRGIYISGGTATILNSTINYSGSSSSAAFNVSNDGTLTGENLLITNGYRGLYTDSGSATLSEVEISEMNSNAVYTDGGVSTLNTSTLVNVNLSSSTSTVYVNTGELNMINSSMENGYRGMTVVNGSALLDTVSIHSMSNHGIYVESNAEISITEGSISETDWPVVFNGPGSLLLSGETTVEDNENQAFYIGHNSLDRDFTIPTAPVPYYFPNHYTVGSDYTFTVDPHNIIKVNNNRRFTIEGAIIADASPDSTIYFTSYADDNLGGDTNNDGTASSPNATSWNGIDIASSSGSTSVFRHTQISYAGTTSSSNRRGAMNLFSASPTVENSKFINNRYGIVLYGTSAPILTENDIGISTVVPIAMVLSADPQFSNNTFSFQANEYDAIGLIDGEVPADSYLPKRDVTDIENVTYLILENLTVPTGVTLEIEAGVVIKSEWRNRITIEGKLLAEGTESEKIVFTSWKDDNFGNPNDTNKDGNQTVPDVGDWYGLYFTDEADDASVLDHTIVQFAESNNIRINDEWYRNAAIMVSAISPTITNSEIRNVNIGIGLIGDSEATITDNSFVNTSSVPLALSMAADPTLVNNSLTNAEIVALGLFGEELGLNGEVKKKNFGGFENITYFILDDITIASSSEVTVDPGIVFKASSSTAIYVDGGFQINGTSDERVVFTSFRDDNFGNPGDTNNDGNATSPSDDDWGTVMYRGTSDDQFNTVSYSDFRFGRVGMAFQDASPTIENTLLNEARYFGITADGAAEPNFENVTIRNMGLDPILLSVKSNPAFSDITFDANGSNGIRILEGYNSPSRISNYVTNTTTIGSDATIFQRDIAGITNIAYVVTTRMNIAPSAKLTINPGVVMKFQSSGSIRVDGALAAVGGIEGGAQTRVVFTDYRDDSSGGDTNNDGNESSPSRGYWNGIEFNSSGMEDENILSHADIRYASSSGFTERSSIVFNSAYGLIENSVIEQSSGSGIAILGNANPDIINNSLLNISDTPIRMNMFANPVFFENTALNVGSMAIGIISETYSVDATVPTRNFSGYENITYEILGDLTINSGTEITIPEGVVFKRNTSRGIYVEGTLKALGTESNPVIFTHISDDDFGSPADTQNDGAASSPSITNRPWITFESSSNDSESIIENSIIRYANYGIELNSSAPTINSNLFEHLTWGMELGGVSEPILTDNTFKDLELAPMEISLVSYPAETTDNVIEGSTYKAIGVVGETLVQDVSLPARTFAGIERIPYYLENNYTIGTGAVLTLEPGVIMKFNRSGISVKKGLVAEGGDSPDELIVFTDYRDDFYGGDTNADSTATTPSTSTFQSWNGITYESESLAPFSILDNVVIKHARNNSRGAVTAQNASPTITNSLLSKNSYGVYATGNANPIINSNDIFDNSDYGVYNRDESFVIDATMNWWGDDSGPQHETNSTGTGDAVSDAVDFDPWEGAGATQLALGDVSLNGSVGAFDGSLVLRHTVGDITLDQAQMRNAEVSGDGSVSAFDAALILQYVVNLISFFPAEAAQKQTAEEPLVEYNVSDVETSIESTQAEPGSVISIPVSIENVSDLVSIQVSLQFDDQLLTLQSIEKTGLSNDMQLIYRYDNEEQTLRVSAAGLEPINESGTVLNILFEVADSGLEYAEASIRFNEILANENDVTPYSDDGIVTIETLPESFTLSQNYPNPFNPTTKINFELPQSEQVSLRVYDTLGRTVAVLIDQRMDAGSHTVNFDASNLASGVYIYRIEASDFTSTQKMLLVK